MNLFTIYDRVSNWNAKRYDRVYNAELTYNLLNEELDEYYEAVEPVHKLDALCDIIYVALGGIWKYNAAEDEMNRDLDIGYQVANSIINSSPIKVACHIRTYIDAIMHDEDLSCLVALHAIINLALIEMQILGLSLEKCMYALSIVCDSNDSKSVQKTASDVKANKDKGALFIAPEPRLQALLDTLL